MRIKITTPEDKEMAKRHIDSLVLGTTKEGKLLVYDYNTLKRNFKRSLKQNNLLWLWLGCIEMETGNAAHDLHDYYIDRFAPREIINAFGEQRVKILTTSKMNESQMSTFLNRIDHDSSTEEIRLPHPEDLHFESFYEKYKNYMR